jgi:hypothetical protein
VPDRPQERAQDGNGFVEPLPALLVGHADGVIVTLRRARTDPRDNPSIGQDIERGERLRQGHGAAQRDKRDRCRQLHGARSFDHGRQGRRAVEPRRLKQEVVIGGNRRKAAFARGVDRASNSPKRQPLAPEFHHGQVNGELHARPILSLHGPHAEDHAAPP